MTIIIDQLPSIGPFALPSGFWGLGIACLQLLVVLNAGWNEVQNPTPYSKFTSTMTTTTASAQIASRQGMLLLYTPSFLLAALYCFWQEGNSLVVSLLLAIHFLKRVLETVFLHRYSGTMHFPTALGISTYYSLSTLLSITTASSSTTNTTTTNISWKDNNYSVVLGVVLFFVGELGNLYHHWLLRQLRSKTNTKHSFTATTTIDKKKERYVPPTGGFFHFVAAPHYLFEVVSFLGIAYCSQSLHSLLIAFSMASYLSGRALLTLRFYQKTFTKHEWSPDKKAILPFVF